MEELKSAIIKHLYLTVGTVHVYDVATLLHERFPQYSVAQISEVLASVALDAKRNVVWGKSKTHFTDFR